MSKKFYSLGNLAFRDATRTSDYNLIRVSYGFPFYNLPYNMPENMGVLYPGELVKFVCQQTLVEQENDQYTAQEIDNLVQDLKIDVERHVNDNIYSSKSTIVDKTIPDNDERLVFNFIKTESKETKTTNSEEDDK